MTHPMLPCEQGLYHPDRERDACGVGFVANIKGAKSHAIVEHGLLILRNLTHRGAVGADPLAGDGAGILLQIPDRFFREEMGKQGIRLPALGEYGVGMVFLPQEPASRLACEYEIERAIKEEGQVLLGWRDVPLRQLRPGRVGQADRAGDPPGVHRPRHRGHGDRRAGAQALHHPQVLRPRHPGAQAAARQGVLRAVHVGAHHRLQGHAAGRPGGQLLQGPAGHARGLGAGAGAPALLDQHLPDLGPGASVPDDRAQRRDQHPARQRQLDPRAPGRHLLAGAGQGPGQGLAADLRRAVGFGLVRQRARAAGHERLLDRPRHDDADSRGLGRAHHDGPQPACLLRVPRGDDGAVGRARRGGLHRRPPDRRHARPQRAAPGALPGDRRRSGDHGLRVRLPAGAGGEDRQEVAPAAGQDVPGRPGSGPHHRRQGAQGRAVQRQALSRVDRAHPHQARRPARAGGEARRAERERARPAAGLRLHAGGHQVHPHADGRERRGADRLHGQRLAAGGAVAQEQDALPLLQAAVRAGHQPADRPDPRGAGDVAGVASSGRSPTCSASTR